MASKAPPIPPDQRAHPGDKSHLDAGPHDRRDGEVNLKEQGRFGNRRQNVDDVQHRVQDR